MNTKKEFPIGTVILFISFIILILIIYLIQSPSQKTVPKDLIAVLRPQAVPIQPFSLTDQNGQPYTENNLKGKWSFLFFGYTYCPDICPTTLTTLKQINNELKKNSKTASDMQVVFVSIDPERDKPEMLAKYISYFSQEFTAVTGFDKNLIDFSRQFSAAYIKEAASTPGDYLMSHTSSIFLVDPQMRIVASFSPPHQAETIIDQYQKIHELFR